MKTSPLEAIRRLGLMPIARPIAERLAASFGQTFVATQHVGIKTWLGLPALPVRTVLDIGACRGGFARDVLMAHFPAATIHSFEPSPVAFKALQDVASSSQGRITAHNFGLGEREERLPFISAADSLPSSSLLPSTQTMHDHFPQTVRSEQLHVDIKILDDVAPTLDIKDDLLVKIDVQGFEDRVIRGGMQTICRARACVVEIQVENLYEGQPTFDDIHSLMRELNFTFQGVLDQYSDQTGRVLYFDAVFRKD